MSTWQNICSAHTEVEKMLVNGRDLKGAEERNKYLMPGDPQSHVVSTALGKHLSIITAPIWTMKSKRPQR